MPFQFDSLTMLSIALCGVAVAALLAWYRSVSWPPASRFFGLLGLLFLAIAAGGVHWIGSKPQTVFVMVDESPSTRGAVYRQKSELQKRVQQLVGDRAFRISYFASQADQTVFAPPSAAAILLFSDCRFELPANAPPIFPVIDPLLESPSDAAVNGMSIRGHDLVVDVCVTGPPRQLTLRGTAATQPITVAGRMSIVQPIDPHATVASASFSPGDAWSENDAMSIPITPPTPAERWWVGTDAPYGWRIIMPANLPTESTAYLTPSVIVLNDQPAAAFSPQQQQRLMQYVRDLGGGLVLVGGPHAFGTGNYLGTPFESLSPLASTPPEPATQWIILVDSSGSMAGESRWQTACDAVARLLPRLPDHDPILLGSFAEQITWWNIPANAHQIQKLPIPPANVSPHGPTNLQEALQNVADTASGSLSKQLLLITDADAQLDQPTNLAAAMKSKSIHLHVLAIGQGSGLDVLSQIASATGGNVRSAPHASQWADQLLSLSQSAMPPGWQSAGFSVQFLSPLKLPVRMLENWNPTWVKTSAEPLANVPGKTIRPVAAWRVGTGQVIAAAFAANQSEAAALADRVAQPSADPRFTVQWNIASKLSVLVNAVDGKSYLNGQNLTLHLQHENGQEVDQPLAIPQTAPGRYELTIDAPRTGGFASVKNNGRLLNRTALPTRYAPEFDAIGNDHAAMHALADRTGGKVIDIGQTKPIDFHWPAGDAPLTSGLAAAGALCVALALIWQRLKPLPGAA